MKVKILTEKELRQAIRVDDEAVAAIEDGFSALAENKAAMPPIMHIEVPEHQGDIDIKAAYVRDMEERLGIPVRAADSVQQLVKRSQTVVTCTPTRTPYLEPAWIHSGLHLTCMGADLPEKGELIPEVLGKISILVCDRKSQCFEMGELHHGLAAGVISQDTDTVEQGEITSGKRRGRQTADQITLCDLTGTGVQDTAIVNLALKKAKALGLGAEIHV